MVCETARGREHPAAASGLTRDISFLENRARHGCGMAKGMGRWERRAIILNIET
jgi:hypothetical protein